MCDKQKATLVIKCDYPHKLGPASLRRVQTQLPKEGKGVDKISPIVFQAGQRPMFCQAVYFKTGPAIVPKEDIGGGC